MQFLEQEILEITETTWEAMLGLHICQRANPETLIATGGFLTGKVEISGAWKGMVLLHGSTKLAEAAASVIFAKERSEVTHQEQLDAVYELTNIIGGNFKSLLPEPCHLSLPSVGPTTSDDLQVAEAELMSELMFDCQQQPLFVTVWKRHDE